MCSFAFRIRFSRTLFERLEATRTLIFTIFRFGHFFKKIDEEEAISTCRKPAKYTENQLIGAAAFEVLRKDLPPNWLSFIEIQGIFRRTLRKYYCKDVDIINIKSLELHTISFSLFFGRNHNFSSIFSFMIILHILQIAILKLCLFAILEFCHKLSSLVHFCIKLFVR